MEPKKKGTNELIYKTEVESRMYLVGQKVHLANPIEKKLLVTRGLRGVGGGRRDKLGDWD